MMRLFSFFQHQTINELTLAKREKQTFSMLPPIGGRSPLQNCAPSIQNV
jgi:hypothetical protein